MHSSSIPIVRTSIRLVPDAAKVLLRPFVPADTERGRRILTRLLTLDEASSDALLRNLLEDFATRHLNARSVFMAHFDRVSEMLPKKAVLSDSRKLLIGTYFTQEYALESAALFNPSIVPHPDQTGLEPGSLRFIMSLRATGEGHISSLTFRTGTILESLQIRLDPCSPYATV
ncbi:MAG: glycosidase, partial [Fibrobacterota bacterium]